MSRSVTAAVAAFFLVAVTVAAASAFSFGKFEKVKVVNGTVSVPASKVADGKARYFKYSDGGKEISFFIVKASDGTFRTAFDACDACFREKKGYVQQGDKMVCKNCNMRFATNRIGPHAVGGCNPSHLPSVTSGDSIVIKAEDLKQGARYF
jgi:uncharacterized membrane protein